MTELKPRIHDESNGLDYVLVGDYYVPDLKLPEEHRPIGMWGRMHRTYLEQYRPARFSALCLSGKLHTYLADLNEQVSSRNLQMCADLPMGDLVNLQWLYQWVIVVIKGMEIKLRTKRFYLKPSGIKQIVLLEFGLAFNLLCHFHDGKS